jgi:tetratricopeptide (TPR) repeat protein
MNIRIVLPDFAFPDDIEDRLQAYLAATGDDLYDLTCRNGVRREQATCDPDLLPIYAFLKRYLASGSSCDLVDLAWHLYGVGRQEQSQAVFLALEQNDDRYALEVRASFHYYSALFQQGLMYFEYDEPELALECFLRADQKYALPGKGNLWSNLGATCHELDRYDEAIVWYQKAVAELVHEQHVPSDGSLDDEQWRASRREQEGLLRQSIQWARQGEPPIGIPGEFGIE